MNKVKMINIIMIITMITIMIIIELYMSYTWNLQKICTLINLAMKHNKKEVKYIMKEKEL